MKRLILQSAQGEMEKYVTLARSVHEDYAQRCGADYRYFGGYYEPGIHPAWNRVPLILDAFRDGYDKVLWLDADVLVVNLDANIFAATDDTTPLHIPLSPSGMVWRGRWAVCDGVMVANRTPGAIAALDYVWGNRTSPLLPHHAPGMWEGNWLLDYIHEHPEVWAKMHQRWNWKIGNFEHVPESEALIRGYHGGPHDRRWAHFTEDYAAVYGGEL